jgi:Bacterial membrane protein YfhO
MPRSSTAQQLNASTAPVRVALAVALLILLSFSDVLLLGRGFYKGDLYRYHFAMKKVVRDVTLAEGLPQWNPAWSGGQPLAANPAYELFYPPQWLVYLPGYAWAFQLHIVLHILLAGLAMYALLRSLDLSEWAAAFGAVTFALGAPYLSLLLRLPFLFSISWMPLVLLFARRAILQRSPRAIALGALAFGMQAIIGEPTVVLQTGMLVASYLAYRWLRTRELRRGLVAIVLLFAAGLVVASCALVPAVDHARDSVRSEGFSWQIASNWSTPPSRLVELAFPRIYRAWAGSNGEQAIRTMYAYRTEPFISDIYLGVLAIVLVVAGLLRRARGWLYVLLLFALSVTLAVGEHAPLFGILWRAGLLKSIRFPEKFLLMGIVALIIWAATLFDSLLRDRMTVIVASIWLILVLIFWASGGGGTPGDNAGPPLAWHSYWVGNVLRAIGVFVLLFMAMKRYPALGAAAVLFVVADFAFVHSSVAERAPRAFFDPPALARDLPPQSSRLFHAAAWELWRSSPLAVEHFGTGDIERKMRDGLFPYSGTAYGAYGVLENDIDQTGLLASTHFLRAAQAVQQRTGVWSDFFLAAANVGATAELNLPGQTPASIHPRPATPRYAFATRLVTIGDDSDVVRGVAERTIGASDTCVLFPAFTPAAGRVTRVDEHPSRIALDVVASGKAFLVISITAHKYWSATIDGQPATLVPANIGFQGLIVAPGTHHIELRYRNPLVVPFAIVSLLAALALALVALLWRDRRPRLSP